MPEKKTQILLVEDEPAHAELIQDAFEESESDEVRLTVAGSIKEARSRMAESHFDLIISDYMLPDGKGIDLISSDNEESTVPVIMMTSQGNEKVAVDAMKTGALDYVVKSEGGMENMPWVAERALREWSYIIEWKRAEKALKLTQFSIDNHADAAFWVGSDAQFIYVNEAACSSLGYTREELLALRMHDIDPNYPAESWEDYWEKIKEQGSFAFESKHVTKDGTSFPVAIIVNFLEFDGNECNCMFAHDITERKQAEEELKEQKEIAEKAGAELIVANEQLEKAMNKASWMAAEASAATTAKSRFLIELSQECRTLVDDILGRTNRMLGLGMLAKRKNLNSMKACCISLQWLIDNVLNLSMIETGEVDLVSVQFDLEKLLAEITQTFSERAKLKDLKFSYARKTDVPDSLHGDPVRLKQVLANLLGNAIEFTDKGEVGLQVEAELVTENHARLVFSVWDSSRGVLLTEIDDDYKSLIQDGTQVDGKYNGDLALTVAKRLVVKMGGEMSHHSVLGQGTTISFKVLFSRTRDAPPSTRR